MLAPFKVGPVQVGPRYCSFSTFFMTDISGPSLKQAMKGLNYNKILIKLHIIH